MGAYSNKYGISVSHVNGSPCFVRKCKKSFFQEAK